MLWKPPVRRRIAQQDWDSSAALPPLAPTCLWQFDITKPHIVGPASAALQPHMRYVNKTASNKGVTSPFDPVVGKIRS
jgi:hypothetical protein